MKAGVKAVTSRWNVGVTPTLGSAVLCSTASASGSPRLAWAISEVKRHMQLVPIRTAT